MTPPLVIAQAAGGPGCGDFAVLMVGMLFILYFFVLRPQIKEERKKADFHASLKVGDEIVTQGGILGRVVELDGEKVQIEVAPRLRFRVEKSAIREHQGEAEAESTAKSDKSAKSDKKDDADKSGEDGG